MVIKTKKNSSFEEVFVPGAGIETYQFGIFEHLSKTLQKIVKISTNSTLIAVSYHH